MFAINTQKLIHAIMMSMMCGFTACTSANIRTRLTLCDGSVIYGDILALEIPV